MTGTDTDIQQRLRHYADLQHLPDALAPDAQVLAVREGQGLRLIAEVPGGTVEVPQQRQLHLPPEEGHGVEGEGHGEVPALLVPWGDLAVPAAEGEGDLHRAVLLPSQLQDLRERQLRGCLAALSRRRPVEEGRREDALDEALPADPLALADQRLTAEAQDLRRPLLPRGEGPGVRKGEVLLRHGGEKAGLLGLLPLLQPGLRRRRDIRGEAQGRRAAGPQADRQAAAGEDLPGVRQAVFQAFQFRLR